MNRSPCRADRKPWEKFAATLLATGFAAILSACAPLAPQAQTTTVMTQASQQALNPEQALQKLKDGNGRFLVGAMQPRDLRAQAAATGRNGQYPFASIVSCIDSRADPALLFDQGIGDLFIARVAGNVVNPDILGSLEYASAVAGSKVIVILGHTHCGAVKGACDDVALGNLTQLLERLKPAVTATTSAPGADRSGKNGAFVDAVAETNVHLTVRQLLAQSPILKQMVEKGQLKVVGAMLDVETGQVRFE